MSRAIYNTANKQKSLAAAKAKCLVFAAAADTESERAFWRKCAAEHQAAMDFLNTKKMRRHKPSGEIQIQDRKREGRT